MKMLRVSFMVALMFFSHNCFSIMPSVGKLNAKELVKHFKKDIKKSFREGNIGREHRKYLHCLLLMRKPLHMDPINSRSLAQRLLWKERKFLAKYYPENA